MSEPHDEVTEVTNVIVETPSTPLASDTEVSPMPTFLPPSMESLIPLPQEPSVHDTIPPSEDIEDTEQTQEERLEHMYHRVLPGVLARKLGVDPKQPWLGNPLIEKVVRATIEELFLLSAE